MPRLRGEVVSAGSISYAGDVAGDLWKLLDREIEIMIAHASAEGAEYPRSVIEDLRDVTNRISLAFARTLVGEPAPGGVELAKHLEAHAAEFAKHAAAFHASKGPR